MMEDLHGRSRRERQIMDDAWDRHPLRKRVSLAAGGAALAMLAVCTTLQLQAEDKSVTKVMPDREADSVIEISAKIIEVSGAAARRILDAAVPARGVTELMSDRQADDFIAKLTRTKGVDMLSAPKVTTRSGQQAAIEVTRDFGNQDKQAKKVGVFLALLPRLDGKDGLKISMDGMVREFDGFRDDPASGEKQPVFREFKSKADTNTRPGTTAVLRSEPRSDPRRDILFLISTRVVPQRGADTPR